MHFIDRTYNIDISWINKYLYFGYKGTAILNWTDGSNIYCSLDFSEKEPMLRLTYKYLQTHYDFDIKFTKVASNLGKGMLWYFVCSVSGRRCRKLLVFFHIF